MRQSGGLWYILLFPIQASPKPFLLPESCDKFIARAHVRIFPSNIRFPCSLFSIRPLVQSGLTLTCPLHTK